MRVLVVEDDASLGQVVQRGLMEAGHVVDLERTLAGARRAVAIDAYHVVVLDLGLPDGDGLALCRELQAAVSRPRVLILTARDATGDKVLGLDAGADDYLTKPFALDELKARVNALGRRTPQERPTVLRVGDLTLDPSTREVKRGAESITLRPKEFALLHLLMRRGGEVLDRAEILDRIWDMNFDGMSNVVDVHVKSLRAKIDKPFQKDSIETVWRVGYRLRTA